MPKIKRKVVLSKAVSDLRTALSSLPPDPSDWTEHASDQELKRLRSASRRICLATQDLAHRRRTSNLELFDFLTLGIMIARNDWQSVVNSVRKFRSLQKSASQSATLAKIQTAIQNSVAILTRCSTEGKEAFVLIPDMPYPHIVVSVVGNDTPLPKNYETTSVQVDEGTCVKFTPKSSTKMYTIKIVCSGHNTLPALSCSINFDTTGTRK